MIKLNKYLDIRKFLPYQRNFIFINAERSIGKTYSTLKYCIGYFLKTSSEFIYLVRTQDEKKKGCLEKALEKVIQNEFKEYKFNFDKEKGYLIIEDKEVKQQITMCHCIALTESVKIKKMSYPKVKYMLFDEYMLEKNNTTSYINGWSEPDLLLSIYHTVDREEDRVVTLLLGNNTSFFNPYHLHKAFNIPYIEKGKIWYSENVLFAWCVASMELKEDKKKNKFLNMIEGTKYSSYAKEGNYIDDNHSFIEPLTEHAKHSFTIEYNSIKFGVFVDIQLGLIFISDKYDPYCKINYALTNADHKENTMLTKGKGISQLEFLAKNYKLGNVRYTSMNVKLKIESGVLMLL